MLVVALCLEDADGQLLLARRPAGKHHGGLWEFPGGKVEPGETPRAALAREVAEELAIRIDPAALVPLTFAADDGLVLLLFHLGVEFPVEQVLGWMARNGAGLPVRLPPNCRWRRWTNKCCTCLHKALAKPDRPAIRRPPKGTRSSAG